MSTAATKKSECESLLRGADGGGRDLNFEKMGGAKDPEKEGRAPTENFRGKFRQQNLPRI